MEGVKGGWRNHPAAKAWEGHECALAMIREWNTMEF
jgi:hypothetical protein